MTPGCKFKMLVWRVAFSLTLLLMFYSWSDEPLTAGQDAGNGAKTAERQDSEAKPESTLVLEPTRSHDRILSFPMKFTAAAGQTVGMLRAQVVPDSSWKFVKVELPGNSQLKVSTKQQKRQEKGAEAKQPAQTVIEITFSAGSHAITNGLIGTLVFSTPQVAAAAPEPPDVRVIAVEPPEVEQTTNPSETPFALPPDATPNPAVSCFFFSH